MNALEDRDYLSLVHDLLEKEEVQYMKNTIQHSNITTFEHVMSVSYMSYELCKKLNWDYRAAARAGLLHDLVYYDWHTPDPSHRLHGYRHPGFALKNASEITELSELEKNIIYRHMWPLTPIPPRYKEAWVITLVDKCCACREIIKGWKK